MINVNTLNKAIKGISEQLPLVNSFYTSAPYESWNVKETQYGSVSFVVTNVATRESSTTYTATLYYADRLTEDNSNVDSVHSDAATVIQTIVGALNTADEFISVSYPVSITLFEQDFADALAGGYATLSIMTEGMGECFDDEFTIPSIVATSAYFTKDEISELFPLKSSLSKVAFSGSFNDLLDTPNLVTDIQYNNLVESVLEVKSKTSRLETEKLNTTTFNEWVNDFGGGLSGMTPLSEFNAFVKGQNSINTNLAVELKNKVSSQYFQDQVAIINTAIGTKISQQQFDNYVHSTSSKINSITDALSTKVNNDTFRDAISLINNQLDGIVSYGSFDNFANGVNGVITNLAVEVGKKLDKDYFDGWKDNIISALDTKVSRQSFDAAMSNVYTKSEVDSLITSKVDKVVEEYVKSDAVEDIVAGVVEDAIQDIAEDVTEAVRVELDAMVEEEISSQIGEFVTSDELQDAIAEQYSSFIGTDEFRDELTQVVESSITEVVGDIVTEAELASKNYASKYYVDNKVAASRVDLSDYPTRDEVELLISNADIKLDDYYTKAEIINDYYSKAQVDSKDNSIKKMFDSYITKTEISNTYITKTDADDAYLTKTEADNYYTKAQVDDIIDNIKVGEDVDLTNYPTKAEVAATYYTKSETYSKTEIDAIVGNIDSILNNVLYNL